MDKADRSVRYIERTRAYYAALGFAEPYRWAAFAEVGMSPLGKPLESATIAVVTTAAPYRAGLGNQDPGAPYNGGAKFYGVYSLPVDGPLDLRISHIAYDRVHTTAADQNTYVPIATLRRAAHEGRIGALSQRLIGLPTDRSREKTTDVYAPMVRDICREDGADAVILVPNCPVCHQSVSLVARYLEAEGLPTVVFGCAKDIVERCRVARFYFSDFPLGNAVGKPFDRGSQDATVAGGIDLLRTATDPGRTVLNPQTWDTTDVWKRDFCSVEALSPSELSALRDDFDREKARSRRNRQA